MTVVSRFESPAGWYELTSRAPAKSLHPHVVRYWGREERSTRPVARLEVPYPHVVVSFSFGPEQRVGTAAYGSFVAGIHERATRTEHDGRVSGVQIALTPLAAHTLFRTPMHALATSCVELEDVLGAAGARLVERLAELPSWDGRFDELDRFFAARLGAPAPELAWAWRQLTASGGRVPIGRLGDELGWSRKRLVAQFRERIGLPPKTFARLLRFRRALTLLGESPKLDVALASGYSDQAHFNRDFRAFAGLTPGEYARRRTPDDPGLPAD
jgi:AraC-like DNA-binding protein